MPDIQTASTPAIAQAAQPRDPSPAELATEFVADPSFISTDDAQASVDTVTLLKPDLTVKSIEKKEAEVVKPIVPAAPPKTEDKVVLQKPVDAKPVVAATDVKPILPIGAQQKTRDYSGFTAEEQSVLKAMSNDAFDHTSKLIKENKELSKLKESSYLQHPLAYTLSPEYTKLQEDAYYLNAEGQYWQQQLAEIAEGREWSPIVGWNKDGSPSLGAKQKPHSIDAEKIRVAMGQCFNKASSTSEQIQQFSGRYKQQIEQDTQLIQQECARRFGWVADPKLLDEKVVNPSVGEKTIKQVRQDFIDLFPPYHQNSVGIQVAAHMFAALQIYGQRIHELENNKQVAAVKEEEKALIETTSKEQPAIQKNDSANGSRGMWESKEFSMEGMPT